MIGYLVVVKIPIALLFLVLYAAHWEAERRVGHYRHFRFAVVGTLGILFVLFGSFWLSSL